MNHYTLAEMTPGLSESFTVTVTEEMMARFEAITGDVSPIHMDAEYAQKRGYPGRVVYGMLGASFFSTLAGVYLPGEHCLLHGGLYIDTSNIWRKVNEKTHIIPVADSLHGCDAFAHGSVC